MQTFHCDHCGRLIYFQNVTCVHCGHTLAFDPGRLSMVSLDAAGDGTWTTPAAPGQHLRLCANYTHKAVCNWAVDAGDPNPLCRSCRLTEVIPDLDSDENREAWARLEDAKRRLLYQLMRMNLPVRTREEDPEHGLAFELKADTPRERVLTGHASGVITVNIAEADPVESERRRRQMGEAYRTLLGHFRHEIAHYYWDLLVAGDPALLEDFRTHFGDERRDYGEALKAHYANGAPQDWQQHYVTAYASSHPWEDWAETFAHYLHLSGALETAADEGVSLQPYRDDEPRLQPNPAYLGPPQPGGFERMSRDWLALSYLLNNLSRSMGHSDSYPFVLSADVIAKLAYVHELLARCAQG